MKTLPFSKTHQLKHQAFEDQSQFVKVKKTKKVSVSKLKATLLKLVKSYIHIRDNDTCQKCGKQVEGSNCQVSHVIPVSHGNALAFDPMNMKIMCHHDHLSWWHKNPLEASAWFKIAFPKRWKYLEAHKNDVVHWKAQDYEQMIAVWRLKLSDPNGEMIDNNHEII